MNDCIVVSELLMQVLVYLATLFFMLVSDVVTNKKPFDDKKKAWRFKHDYWRFRNDDMIKMFIGGTLGALLAKIVGLPIIEMIGMPGIAEDTGNLTAIVFSTKYMPALLNKALK